MQNIYGNKGAPSRDIAYHFATIEHLRYICDGGCSNDKRCHQPMDDSIVLSIVLVVLYRCGEDLKMLFSTSAVQHFMNSTPLHKLHCNKTIYQPGTLRKVSEIILFIIVCYIYFVNQKVPQAIPFSAVTLDLPDVQGGVVTVTNLSLQQPPFDIHWSNLKHDDF